MVPSNSQVAAGFARQQYGSRNGGLSCIVCSVQRTIYICILQGCSEMLSVEGGSQHLLLNTEHWVNKNETKCINVTRN